MLLVSSFLRLSFATPSKYTLYPQRILDGFGHGHACCGMEADVSRQPFFGAMGCTSAIVFTCFGAAYGTAKSGVGISAMGVLRPDLIVKSTLAPGGIEQPCKSE